MITIHNGSFRITTFPDGTQKINTHTYFEDPKFDIHWFFDNDGELITIYQLVEHFREMGMEPNTLFMPYVPNARMDRVKYTDEVFTLKYFCKLVNSLGFRKVSILDPHSYVTEALIDRVDVQSPGKYIVNTLDNIKNNYGLNSEGLMLFFPDEGAMKRYSCNVNIPYAYGAKNRSWKTGEIQGLTIMGNRDDIFHKDILIIDDICSRGGTFMHSAKALKECGASRIFLYVTHCEDTIHDGEILTSDLIRHVYTTNSIFRKIHEKVTVFDIE